MLVMFREDILLCKVSSHNQFSQHSYIIIKKYLPL
jgi:hypothetical protein